LNIDRKIEVLVLPGRQSNEGLAGFQLNAFKGVVGKDANLTFQEADTTWSYEPYHDLHDADDMSRTLSKGKPFKTWFNISSDDPRKRPYMWKFFDPNVKISYSKKEAESEVQKLIDRTSGGDFDVVLGMFEGSIVVHMAVAKLMAQGKPVPWRLSVFFGSMPIRDDQYLGPLATGVANHPAVMVFGRSDQDYFYARGGQGGRRASEEYYSSCTVLEHLQGHQMPSDQPVAKDIYDRILGEMKYHCGQGPKPPRLPWPARPTSFPLLDLLGMFPKKLKVLSLAGGHSCEAINKVQTAMLKNRLGQTAEWSHLAGSKVWEWYDGEPTPTDTEKMFAGKNPLMNWYLDKAHETGTGRLNRDKQFDPNVDVEFFDIPEVLDHLEKFIEENGPFDVIVAFSQACIILHMLIGRLRKRALKDNLPEPLGRSEHQKSSAEEMPWRLSCFFSGMHVRDRRWQNLVETDAKSSHPTVFVYGKADEYYDYAKDGFGSRSQEDYYEKPLVLEHEESHQFPSVLPRANEINDRVIDKIWSHCGGRLFDEPVPTPPAITAGGAGGKSDLWAIVGPQRPPPV